MIENRAVGIKSREVYEAPAAMTLIAAHSALEDVVLTKDEARLKRPLEQRWTEIVYEGRWFSPAREAIDAFVDSTQELVTGEVRRRAAAERRGRHRAPLAAHDLRDRARLVRHRRDVPARRRRGLHPHLVARDRAARRASARRQQGIIAACDDAGQGRVEERPRPRRVALPPRRRRRAPPVRLRGDRRARAHGSRRPGCSPTTSSTRPSRGWREIAQDPDGYLESDEDVHSAIERLLGDVGRKIHAGRSRNDQVAAAFRMYVLDACAEAREAIDALALVVLSFAESEAETVMPGYTHLQRAQPVTLGHHLLAWVEMLDRDRTRFAAAAERRRREPARRGRARRLDARAPTAAAPHAQLDRRHGESRLPDGGCFRARHPGRAPLAHRRRNRDLVDGRVRFHFSSERQPSRRARA